MRLAFQAHSLLFVILLKLLRILYSDNTKLGSHYSWPWSLSATLSYRENNPVIFDTIFPFLVVAFFRIRSIQLCWCSRTVETPQMIGNFVFLWKQSHAVSLHKKTNWMAFESCFLRTKLKKLWKTHSKSQEMLGFILVLRGGYSPSCQQLFLSTPLLQFCTERKLVASLRWYEAWSIHDNFWISFNISLNLMRSFPRASQSVADRTFAFLFSLMLRILSLMQSSFHIYMET